LIQNDPNRGQTLERIMAARRRRRLLSWIGVVALLCAGLAYFFLMREEPPPPPTPIVEQPPPALLPAAPPALPLPLPPKPVPIEPAPEPPPEPPLPKLAASDSLTRELFSQLSRRPALARWLVSGDLIRRFVAAVDNVAEGNSPREQLDSMWPVEKYRVIENDGRVVLDPSSFERYDEITEVLVLLDSARAVAVYRKLEPLIGEAYRDLGYPNRDFDETLGEAIDELLRAPVVVGEVELDPQVMRYEYRDLELEGLSDAQKQLLRMGPTNVPQVQSKLREFAITLSGSGADLPRTTFHQVVNPPRPEFSAEAAETPIVPAAE
jgi:hypothetical protein